MGAYLSEPVTTKETESGANDVLEYGATTMQGWRVNQEDAHNAILNYDDEVSLFAVYDGHGGPEVAEYAAKNFPDFLRSYLHRKEGEVGKAIQEAFIAFDETLTLEAVLRELTVLADGAKEKDNMDEEDKRILIEEAHLPLEEVLLRYGYSMTECEDDGRLCISQSSESSKRPRRKRRKPGSTAAVKAVASEDAEVDSTKAGGDTVHSSLRIPGVVDGSDSKSINDDGELKSGSTASDESSELDAKMAIPPTDLPPLADLSHPIHNGDVLNNETKSNLSPELDDISATITAPIPSEHNLPEIVATGKGDKRHLSLDAPGSVDNHRPNAAGSPKPKRLREDGGETANGDLNRNQDDVVMGSPIDRKEKSLVIRDKSEDLSIGSGDDDEDDDADFVIDVSKRDLPMEDSEDEETSSASEDGDEDDEDDYVDEDEDSDEDLQFAAPSGDTPGMNSGTTACLLLIYKNKLYVGNAGDSRCVLSRAGRAVELSVDHKPEDPLERERIEKAGGKVTSDGRVNSGLNLSRAFGDHAYKQNEGLGMADQMISALPDVVVEELTKDDEFLVIACDGIWNSLTSAEVVEFVQQKLQEPSSTLESICHDLCERCLAKDTVGDGTGCDNMTVLIVKFKREGDVSRIRCTPSQVEANSPIKVETGKALNAVSQSDKSPSPTGASSKEDILLESDTNVTPINVTASTTGASLSEDVEKSKPSSANLNGEVSPSLLSSEAPNGELVGSSSLSVKSPEVCKSDSESFSMKSIHDQDEAEVAGSGDVNGLVGNTASKDILVSQEATV